ncbi:MAG TPA: hypothetical protein VGC93_02200 [Thermoanaerobaculia bacterium]
MALAVTCLVGAWQVGADLLSNTAEARAWRIAGMVACLLVALIALPWGFSTAARGTTCPELVR